MNNPLKLKLLWLSFFVHILVLIFIDFSYNDSKIKRAFVALGRHSKRISHAYFHHAKAPNFSYRKYLQARRAKEQQNRARLKKQKAKKLAKKKTVKKKPTKLVKKEAPKKKVHTKKMVKNKPKKIEKKKIKKQEEKPIEQEELNEEEILHFNLLGETDPKMFMYQQYIQQEVDRVWQPPIGVPKGTECVVTFAIDSSGKVKSFNIDKSSKVLIYDLSIVRVGKEFKFNKCLWSKSFTINFRQ